MDIQLSQAWIAVLGTIFGGAGFKFVEYWLTRNQRQDDTAAKLREELRTEVQSLREELHRVEAGLEEWREKYYNLLGQFLSVKNDLERALHQIKANAQEAEEKLRPQP